MSPGFDGEAVAMALMGGAVLGATVAFKTGLTGNVLGVSGSTRHLMTHPSWSALLFNVGLVVAGTAMNFAYGGFERLPPAGQPEGNHVLFLVRLGIGGFFVGGGSALGSGCTSGHGLTGLARLTPRSWTAVPCFMLAAAITATVLRTASAFPSQLGETAPALSDTATWSVCLMAALLFGVAAAPAIHKFLLPPAAEAHEVKVLAELASGFVFGCGLALSTMVRPSKVAGFLDLASGAWDPSLPFVMGGALCITFPFFRIVEGRAQTTPLLGGKFGLPDRQRGVDRDLVLGSVLFGIGWGTCGMCPGPIWVAFGAKPTVEMCVEVLGMLCGMFIQIIWTNRCRRAATSGAGDSKAVELSAAS